MRFYLAVIFMSACSSGLPQDGATSAQPPAQAALPQPLVDARDFVQGRVVAETAGWVFEGGTRRSEVMPWPKWPEEPPCLMTNEAVLAWPIEGTNPQRYLVFQDEPMLVEARIKCLVGVAALPRSEVLFKRDVTLTADASALSLSGVGPGLEGLDLMFDRMDSQASLRVPGGVLDPEGGDSVGREGLVINCWEPESHQVDPENPAAPFTRKAAITGRGSGATYELEVVVDTTCSSDPEMQGGPTAYETTTRWVLTREPSSPSGWAQVLLSVSTSQSASGDGAAHSLFARGSVFTWRKGAMTMAGTWHSEQGSSESRFGGDGRATEHSRWAVLPSRIDAKTFDEAQLDGTDVMRLVPSYKAPARAPDIERPAAKTGDSVTVDGCELTFEERGFAVACGGQKQLLQEPLSGTTGEFSRSLRVWDLGPSLLLEVELWREHRWTEPVSEDDPSELDRLDQEQRSWRFFVAKRTGAVFVLDASSGVSSY